VIAVGVKEVLEVWEADYEDGRTESGAKGQDSG
jgi:hypothetical protein